MLNLLGKIGLNIPLIIVTFTILLFIAVFVAILFLLLFRRNNNTFRNEIRLGLAKIYVNINNDIFSIVIGDNADKQNLSSYLLLDHACKKSVVNNVTSEYKNIVSIIFVKINNIVIVTPIIQDLLTAEEKCTTYGQIIEIFSDIFNTNRCISSIILQINDIHFSKPEDIYDLQGYIKSICISMKLNVPVYIDFNMLHNVKYAEVFVSNISKRHCLQMIGYGNSKYDFDILSLQTMYNSMDILINKMNNIVYALLLKINNYSIAIQLVIFVKELKKFLYKISDYAYQISKLVIQRYVPAFRGFIVTGFFCINQQYTYTFVSDFINYKLIGESNLIDLGYNHISQGRSKTYEVLLAFFFLASTTYLLYSSKCYIDDSNSSFIARNRLINSCNICDIQQIDDVVKNLYVINTINNDKFSLNILNLIELYCFNRKHKLNILNATAFNFIYKSLYNEVKTHINSYINFYKNEIDHIINGRIESYLKSIGDKYELLYKLTESHNSIKNSDDIYASLIKLLIDINKSTNCIQQDSIEKLQEIKRFAPKVRYLENFKDLYLSEEATFYSVQQIILKIKEYIDDQNYIQQLRQIYDKIIIIVNSNNIYNKISVLGKLIDSYDFIKQLNFIDIFNYKICIDTLDYFKSINYISDETVNRINRDLTIASDKLIAEVREIKHDIIGSLIDTYNFKVSDYVNTLMNDLKALYMSDLCKRYLLINKHSTEEKSYQAICIPANIEFISRILEEYNEIKSNFPGEKISYITLNMLDQILVKNITHILNQDFNYFDLQNNSQNFILKKIIENYNKLEDNYNHILDYVVMKNNEPTKEFLRKIFSGYIDIIYKEIISLNIFRENSNVSCISPNFITAAFATELKEDCMLKIKDSLHKLIKLSRFIKPLIYSLSSKKKHVVYTKDLEKLAFIYSTIEIFEDYKEDSENNKISILINEIIKLLMYEHTALIKPNREIYNNNNYVSYAYTNIIDKYKKYIVQKQKYDLKQLLKELRLRVGNKAYPFASAENADVVVPLYELSTFYEQSKKILQMYNSIGKGGVEKLIVKVLNILEDFNKTYISLTQQQDINIQIVLDDVLASITKVTIIKEDGDHKEITSIQDDKSIYFNFKDTSKFIMKIPSIPIPGFKYGNVYTKYLKIKNNVVFTINEALLLHALYLAHTSGHIDKNSLIISFEIPIIFESVNTRKSIIDVENITAKSVLIITPHKNIIKVIEKLPNLIEEFSNLVKEII